MRYRDTTEKPFVLVNIDPLSDVDLREAAAIIKAAKVYHPAVWWRDGAERFEGDLVNGSGTGIAMKPDESACKYSLHAVKQIGRLRAPGVFVISSKFDDVPAFDRQTLTDALLSTIRSVGDGGGKRFILICSRRDLDKTHPGLFGSLLEQSPGLPQFEKEKALPASHGKPDFRAAMCSPAPRDFREDWAWADNAEFLMQVENLTAEQTQELIAERLHEPALERLRAAVATTRNLFCDRDHAVEMMLACGVAKVNLVYLGPPGTAKSELVRAFARALGIRPNEVPIRDEYKTALEARRNADGQRKGRPLFEYLLTRYTTPEELFGSTDVDLLLSKGVHGRRTDGMLPQAEIGFLDEIFKANTAILNALLSLTNERLFFNMGQAFKVNLAFVVGASNETPADEELGALYDRFPIRVPCLPVTEKRLIDVIQMAHDLDREKGERVACLNDVRLLSKVAWAQESFGGAKLAFPVQGKFKSEFEQLLLAFREEFRISDRTPYRILRLCRALALLDGDQTMQTRQLRAWGYVAPRVAAALDLQQLVSKRLQQWDESCGKLFDSHS